MSRIGKKPVAIPDGVTATIDGKTVTAKGPKGELTYVVNEEVLVAMEDGAINISPRDNSKDARTMIENIVTGVTSGFERKLEINGVGYRAAMQGKKLQLALGYSHDVIYELPEGVSAATPKPTEIVLTGINKQQLGQVAAEIRKFRPPEPYKGKGVKYAEETIVRKEGKKK